MGDGHRIAISLPSTLGHLDLIQLVAEQVARGAGFDEDGQLDFGLAIREGAINAMKHGNGFDESTPVRVEFVTKESTIRAAIVGSKSIVIAGVLQVVAAGMRPGHQKIVGTRQPPSNIVPLPSRSGAADPAWSP